MRHGFLKFAFVDDGDGTGELSVEASVEGFSGRGSAYFNIDRLKQFASDIGEFPLPQERRCRIASGFWSKEARGNLEQEHLGVDVYPVDRRGHIGVQVRTATELWQGARPDSQKTAKLEIITTYEPLARFSKDLRALLEGSVQEATLEGEGG